MFQTKRRTIFVAHRGESYDAPENTLASINLAWRRNADAVEIDVLLSRDNEIVVIHDRNLSRLAGIDANVADHTLAELQKLDVGSYKGESWANERIPILAEVIETVPPEKLLVIEIKCGSEILPILENVISNSGLKNHQIKVIGFDLDVMKAARKAFPEHEIFWIKDIRHFQHLSSCHVELETIIQKTVQASLDGLCFSSGKFIDKNFVDKIKETKLACHIWTVDHVADARQFIDAGVDGIISNRPHWLKSQLGII